MKGWKRKMRYEETGLQWIPSSPHIPQPVSAVLYPATGILGELGYVSIGVGYTIPFQLIASDWIKAEELAGNLNRLNLPGIHFCPVHLKPFYSVGQGQSYQGVQIHIMDYEKARLSEIQFYVMQEIAVLYPERAIFDHANKDRFRMFDQVSGSNYVRETFAKNNRFADIKDFWYKETEPFRQRAKKYYLYK